MNVTLFGPRVSMQRGANLGALVIYRWEAQLLDPLICSNAPDVEVTKLGVLGIWQR